MSRSPRTVGAAVFVLARTTPSGRRRVEPLLELRLPAVQALLVASARVAGVAALDRGDDVLVVLDDSVEVGALGVGDLEDHPVRLDEALPDPQEPAVAHP